MLVYETEALATEDEAETKAFIVETEAKTKTFRAALNQNLADTCLAGRDV